jgi:hypothetical protein
MNPHDPKDKTLNCRYTFNDKNERDGLMYVFCAALLIAAILFLIF